ncbi:down syndrome cell adhesion molecule-like protein Dscam2 [Trichonephila inaurata madagascariensis]|uniref:Down syndrome cell adhesion molecule-like protein Dscam2 n=1 Tax=Trichonephila inaurata madagascariensis TaxID=2747483 RepID=A0A8X6YK71_9ARAC|nr:down syndrome cell adhesion molecule-like protein Dscam2 [Trichonephila inaurata madagascariensis]
MKLSRSNFSSKALFTLKRVVVTFHCVLSASDINSIFHHQYVLIFSLSFPARSYTVLRSGELLIHEIQEKDSNWSYRCQTRHRLTGEMVTSVSSGKIVVTGNNALLIGIDKEMFYVKVVVFGLEDKQLGKGFLHSICVVIW